MMTSGNKLKKNAGARRLAAGMLLIGLALGGCASQPDSSAHNSSGGTVDNGLADATERTVGQAVQRKTPAVTVSDFSAAQTWGAATNVVAVKHLYFSEQPDAQTLVDAGDRGVGVVINMREPAEMDWDEAGAARGLGMTYYNVPIAAQSTSFDAVAMKEISALVGKHKDTKILLHCSSGNRASAYLAIHLVQDHGMNVETSISLARLAGLTKPDIESRVRQYLSEVEQSPLRAE